MEALRGQATISKIYLRHGIHSTVFYKWNKEFMVAGKKRLAGDIQQEATSDEVPALRKVNQQRFEIGTSSSG